MVFTHKMWELMDLESRWWVVPYAELVGKSMTFELMDVYDNYRLWVLSPHVLNAINNLGLDVALRNRANTCEIQRLLRLSRIPTSRLVRLSGCCWVRQRASLLSRRVRVRTLCVTLRRERKRYHTLKR